MHYKQLIDFFGPLEHWTFENSSGDNTTVYGEYTRDLLNSNATLGEEGQTNHNFSGRSANLKNGHLIVADGAFLQPQISDHDFAIHFCFKTNGSQVAGSHALISKWTPVPQFWIGFESGNLVAKVETSSAGQISLVHDNKDIIYNDYWNMVTFLIHSNGTYRFILNGIEQSTSDSNPLQGSILSQFTIGDPTNPFSDDIWINDVAIQDSVEYTYLPLLIYRMTRSDKEAIQGLAPKYLFDFVEGWLRDGFGPIPNEGSEGGVGYLMSKDGTEPNVVTPSAEYSQTTLNMPKGVYFTIDNDLDFDWANTVSFLFVGHQTTIDNSGEFGHNDNNLHWNYEWMDLGESRANPDNWRIRMAYMDGGNNELFGFQTKDGSGNQLGSLSPANGDWDAYNTTYDNWGIFRYKFDSTTFYVHHHDHNDWTGSDESDIAGGVGGYAPGVPLAYNRFFYRDDVTDPLDFGSINWHRCRYMAIFDYDITDNHVNIIQYPRIMLFNNFFMRRLGNSMWYGMLRDDSSPEWRYRHDGTFNTLWDYKNGWFGNSGIDPLFNRPNEFTYSWYMADTSRYISQYYNTDNNPLGTNNLTINFWIRNQNTTSMYELFGLHYNSGYTQTTMAAGYRLGIAVNSHNRSFGNVGDLEFTTNDYSADYTVYVPEAIADDGWHMVTVVRNSTRMEVWVDGILKEYKITPTVQDFGTSNRAMQFRGGPCFLREIIIDWYDAWAADKVEFAFQGFADVVKGQTLLNTVPIQSQLLAVDHKTGHLIAAGASEPDGDFTFKLVKNDQEDRDVDIIALPYDSAATNHVVVHGPYNANTVYSRYIEEVLSQSMKDMILDMDPYVYYPMDDTSGTTIVDNSGNGRNGTISGDYTLAQEAMEVDSKSIDFGGTNAFIDMPDGFDNFPDGVTLEVWARTDSTSLWARYINLGSALEGVDEIRLARESSSSNLNAFVPSVTLTGAGNIQNGVWQHFVFRIDADGTGSLWASGTKVAESGGMTPANVLRDENFIGRSLFAADAYFHGRMSHAVVYDHALSDEDIYKHYFRGIGLNHATLKGAIEFDNPEVYWTFDRQQGLVDEIEGHTFTVNGTHDIQKNALVLNDSAVGNNYLHTDQYVLNQSNNDEWTIEFGFKCPTTQSDAVLVAQWDEAGNDGSIKIALMNTNKIVVYMNDNTNSISSTTDYNDGKWHHVMVTYDGAVVRLYVDGDEEAYFNITMAYPGHDLTVGNTSDGHVSWHLESRAEIDDLAIYGTLLGSARIEAHYNRFEQKKGTL
jgi:hypothetical protein